jgi:hypothetical protein
LSDPAEGTLNPPIDGTLNEKDDPPAVPTAPLGVFMLDENEELPNENGAADDDDDDDDAVPDMDTDVGLKEKVGRGLIVFVAGKETGTTTPAPSFFIGWNEKEAAVVDDDDDDDDDAVPIIELNTNGADDAISFGLCLSEVSSGALVVSEVTPAD